MFYLGCQAPDWLARANVPLFVSRRRLEHRKTFPRAAAPWALDSGGFTELSMFGEWTLSVADYAAMVERFTAEIGTPDFVAPMDWMCEPQIRAQTGLSVADHQARTIFNYGELHARLGSLVMPVLQGWTVDDYIEHVEAYAFAGVDLRTKDRVGLGTVCRRQDANVVEHIVSSLSSLGLHLHGFGVKIGGLRRYADELRSADSLAWSVDARHADPLPGHTHKNCANCIDYALAWRGRVLDRLQLPRQTRLAV